MRYLTVILLLLSGAAYGTVQPEPVGEATATAKAVSAANAKAGAKATQSQSQDNQQSNKQRTSQDVDINYNSDYERSAPAVTAISGHSTADMLVCYGLGGSSPGGAATGLWCHLQRDLYAEHRMDFLSTIGLNVQAAKAYCDRRLHHQDFESKADCNTTMAKALKDKKVEITVTRIEVDAEEACEGRYGETVVKEYLDNGISVLYDCKERVGKSG